MYHKYGIAAKPYDIFIKNPEAVRGGVENRNQTEGQTSLFD